MILTQCPSCRTLFQVDQATLEASAGAVRCGRCGAVFEADVYQVATEVLAKTPRRRARRWAAGLLAGCLAVMLILQILYVARAPLARSPLVRPVLMRVCRRIPCHLPHPADLGRYALRHARIRLIRPGRLQIAARLVNTAPFAQSLPRLAVSLLGHHHRLIARVDYRARRYLHGLHARLGPRQSAAVRLTLAIPRTALGYRLSLIPQG